MRTYPEGARDNPGDLAAVGDMPPEDGTVVSGPGAICLYRQNLPKQCL